jgi:class 3 adenylate cyclase
MPSELESIVERHVGLPCAITAVDAVGSREDVLLGGAVGQLEATSLSIDIRQFTGMTNTLGRQVMVKMLKAFFEGSVRLLSQHGGVVADFNGDGMIVLFSGPRRTEGAFLAAANINWFTHEVLKPRFADYFSRNGRPFNNVAEFDAGCGIDDGIVLIARVGTSEFSDLAWVGRCVNSSAKLCKAARWPESIAVTHEAYERLDGVPLLDEVEWSAAGSLEIGGASRTVFGTGFAAPPDFGPASPASPADGGDAYARER